MKRKTNGFPSTMHLDGTKVSGSEDITNLFAIFFEGVYDDKVINYNTSCKSTCTDFGSLCLSLREISRLDVKKGCGPDGIAPVVLQKYSSAFSIPLYELFITHL